MRDFVPDNYNIVGSLITSFEFLLSIPLSTFVATNSSIVSRVGSRKKTNGICSLKETLRKKNIKLKENGNELLFNGISFKVLFPDYYTFIFVYVLFKVNLFTLATVVVISVSMELNQSLVTFLKTRFKVKKWVESFFKLIESNLKRNRNRDRRR